MAIIVIKDLADNVDLDRQAMLAIIGGARVRGRSALPGQTILRNDRIINFLPQRSARNLSPK